MYDVLVIGAGPAGMTAAIYAARAGYKTAMAEVGVPGGQAATTEIIENYPGFPNGVAGPDLMYKFFEQTQTFGVEMLYGYVEGIDTADETKKVKIGDNVYESKTVIIASGAKPKTLGVANEDRLRGRGVSYCATCDGFFFKDKEVMVVGGGDTAVEEAMYLTKMCSKVTLIHRREQLRANRTAQNRALANEKLEIIYNTTLEEIIGEDKVTSVRLKNKITGEETIMPIEGIFIFAGYTPNNDFFPSQLAVDERGYVLTDEKMATNLPGIFAVGDVRQKPLRQVTTAVGDGGVVITAVEDYLAQ
ncbi:MAG: thioredoxin-disulfide reductase [Clostridiales bacterium]|nr:MAG: thioredoxin-disulfide reductase [Clostridiales bacterium]